MYSRTVVTGETHTFEGVVNSRTESFKGRVKYTLWQGDKLVEQFPSYYFECKGKNFFNTLAIPCFVTVVPGTYRLKMLLKEEGKNNLLIYSNRTFTAKFKLARFLIAGEEGYIVTIMGTNPTVAVDIKQIGKNAWNTITYGNEKYVAVGYDSYITYSIDGVIWESPSHTSWGTDYIRIAYGNGRFAIVKEPSTAATVSVTSDFIDYNGSLYESGSFVYDIAYGKNKFVGVGSRSGLGIAYVLNDGSSKWSSYYKVIVGSIKSIIFDGNQFVTLNNSGYVSTSSNGTSWSEQGYTGTYFLTNMAYGNGIYVGCGDGGYVSMSNDCTIWTTPKRIGTNKWLAVTYGGGLFLMVGEKGYISSSSDGINWTTPKQIQYGDGNVLTVNLNDIFLQ